MTGQPPRPLNILVTGGAGFIGSHSADELIRLGHRVVILDNLSTGKKANIHPDATFVEGDLRTVDFDELLSKYRIDRCLHLAAQASVAISVKDPSIDAQHNILGTLRLLDSCARYGVQKIVFSSTGGAIYKEEHSKLPYTEKQILGPVSPYAISKEACERYIEFYSSVYHLPSTILRYSNVYGPRQDAEGEGGVVAIFSTRMLSDEELGITGDGNQTRDYVFVKDVARINALAVLTDHEGIYNVSTGAETTVNEVFNLIKEATGSQVSKRHVDARKGEVRRSALDATKVLQTFDWTPEFKLEQGILETIKSIQQLLVTS